MGCGQSKINLYPRRNKNSSKANGSKKAGTSEDKETDEEEGGTGGDSINQASKQDEERTDSGDVDRQKDILPLAVNTNHIEPSPSQQDFFKMLDDRIEQGKDYDSSSETEVQLEHQRKAYLLQQWNAASEALHFTIPSPPTPARKRPPQSSKSLDRNSPSNRRCLKNQQSVVGELPPPSSRRCASADQYQNGPHKFINGSKEWPSDVSTTPVRKMQNPGWKSTTKITPYSQTNNEKSFPDPEEEVLVAISNDKRITNNQEITYISRDTSQITYNPTFQTHSPAHQRSATVSPQPYIAQIVTYPKSQHVAQAYPAYIAPPETYQDPKPSPKLEKTNQPSTSQTSVEMNEMSNSLELHNSSYSNQVQPPTLKTQVKSQSAQNLSNSSQNTISNSSPNIYYIHGNPQQEKIISQRQQTALHLQQYVAMKQAQQNMLGYLQRMPNTIYPNPEYLPVQNPDNQPQEQSKVYETVEEAYGITYYPGLHPKHRPQSAPNPNNQPKQPYVNPALYQLPLVSQIPFMGNVTTGLANYGAGQMPQMEVKYYHHYQQNAYRPGSAGTLTRYQKPKPVTNTEMNNQLSGEMNRPNVCQSINIVRQKSVGQIVPVDGSIGVYKTVNANNTSIQCSTNDGQNQNQSSQIKSDDVDRNTNSANSNDKNCKKKSLRTLKKSKSGDLSSK